jgi:hypothetical protein
MQAVEGVVLVDEIETHLHPRWKIAIIGALRQLFPRVRFIATTHDPLCVQGLRKGELHVMTRSAKDEEVAIEQVDVRPGLRADQILTGEWFGVPSTRDPETVGMIAQHSELLQLRERTPDQQAKLDALDEELRLRLDEYIGTRDQQIALRAAADFRAERGAGAGREAPLPAQALREKILAALRGAGG